MTTVETATQSRTAAILAAVAHEMRTPLTTLAMTSEILADDAAELDPAQTLRMIERIRRATLWLSGLVDNLGLSGEDGTEPVHLRLETFDVLDCVREAIAMVEPQMSRKGQRVRLTSSRRVGTVTADPLRLRQAVLNLLVNASKYSVEDDVVDVNVAVSRGRVVISVTDHGPGIDPAEQARIFSPYVRGADAAERGSGLGLGLSIVKTLVEAHGGEVGVHSIPGAGASFAIAIPTGGPR